MSNFWKNASIMTIAELFLKLKAVIMMPFITKYLGAINYGVWSQVMVIVSLLSPLIFFGMDNSLNRFLPGKPLKEQRQEFTGWLTFGFISSAIILIFSVLCREQFSKLFFGAEAGYSEFVLLAGANIMTTSMLTGIRNWFRIQNNAWALVTLTIMQNLLQMLVLIFVLVNHLDIYALVLGSLVIDGLTLLGYIIYFFINNIFIKPTIHWLKPYFRFGIFFLPSGYAVWVLNSLDRIFLAQYHTLADIGIYSIGFTIGYTLIQMIVNPIWSLFPPKAAELYNTNNIKELNILFNQSIKLICWVIFPSIFGLIVTGDILLSILSTAEFSKGYLVIPIILAGYLSSMLSSYFETILVLKNKPFLSTFFTVIACVFNIILNFLLIPKFSYMGAAAATTLAFGLQLTLSFFWVLKEKLILFDAHTIVKIFNSSVIMFVFICLIKKNIFYETNILSILMLSILGFCFYVFLTSILGVYKIKNLVESFKRNFA